MRSARTVLAVLLLGAVIALGTDASDKKDKPVKPPTKQTQMLRAETFKKFEEAQKRFDAKDYAGAVAALDEMKARADKLNDYERATLWNLYAAVHYAQNNTQAAISDYINVLKQDNLPEGLRDNSLYSLAQMYFIVEDYKKAIAVLQKWFAVVGQDQPDGYALLAQADYQLGKYKDCEQALLQALRIGKSRNQPPKENWLALLRAVYYELKQYDKAAKVLEVLVAQYPAKATYWQQLSGMYGLLDRPADQLKALHAAYQGGLLNKEPDLLNLARLYLLQDAPFPAVRLMHLGMKSGVIKDDTANLQLLAQALAMAKEFDAQIPVLEKLAQKSGASKHYVYLGQAYAETGKWAQAAQAFRSALTAKDVQKVADVEVQLGTALYNAGKLDDARKVFADAANTPATAAMAGNWVKFVSSEIQRKQALDHGRSAGRSES